MDTLGDNILNGRCRCKKVNDLGGYTRIGEVECTKRARNLRLNYIRNRVACGM